MGAQAGRMEVLALAVPVIAIERDAMRAVFAAERDLEAPEADPFGLFGVTLRLLDLGDEARVHQILHTPVLPVRPDVPSLDPSHSIRDGMEMRPISRKMDALLAAHMRLLEFFRWFDPHSTR